VAGIGLLIFPYINSLVCFITELTLRSNWSTHFLYEDII
jgi:hypothetical protein